MLDADSAATEAEAIAIAAKFDHEVLVDGATNGTTRLWAQPDGSLRMRQSTLVERVRRDGQWVPLDLKLRPAGAVLAPGAADVPVEFSAGGDGPLFRVQGADGRWVSASWDLGPLPAPKVSGAAATYEEVLPGVDMRLAATAQGMTQVLIVKTPEAAADPRVSALRIGVDGAAKAQEGAPLTAEGDANLVMSAPTWWDSKSGGSASGPGVTGVPRPLDSTAGDGSVRLDVASAARAEGVQYPLFIDPSWSGGVQARTFTDSAYPNQPYWNGAGASDGYQHVGYINAANSDDGLPHTTRSYWHMDSSAFANTYVTSAYFNTTLRYSSSCNARQVDAHSVYPVPSSTTWNTQPAPSTHQSSQTVAHGYSGSCPQSAVGFNVLETAAGGAALGRTTLAVVLKANNETDWLTWKKFDAAATLDVVFTRGPGTPTLTNATCSRYPGLVQGDVMRPGDIRWSQSAMSFLILQGDGNLVLYKASTPGSLSGVTVLWAAYTSGPGRWAVLQGDGNFVVYDAAHTPLWWNSAGAKYMVVQNDGGLVGYTSAGVASWWTGPTFAISGTAVACWTNATWSTISATAPDNNGGLPLRYQIEVFYGLNPGAAYWIHLSTPAATASWNVYWPSDGGFTFRVKACVTAPDSALICSPYSTLWGTIIDRVAPEPPVVTPVAGDGSFLPSTFAGTVGRSDATVRISPQVAGSDNIAGYMYRVMPTASDGTLTDVDAATFPANPQCGTTILDYTVVCVSRIDFAFDVTLAAMDERTQLSVLAFDMAGNSTATSGVGTVQLNSKPDIASTRAGHSWTTSASAGCTSVADNAPTGKKTLLMASSACRGAATVGLPVDPGAAPSSLHLNVSAAGNKYAYTSTPVVDTTKSFTVGGWLNPSVPMPAGQAMTAFAQDGADISAFFLQLASERWTFCVSPTNGTTFTGTCVQSVNKVVPNQWTFVVGVWDAINHQIRLYVSGDGATYTPTVQANQQVMASGGVFAVGRDSINGAHRYWRGQIVDPFVFQGVISVTTFQYLGQMMWPTNLIPVAP